MDGPINSIFIFYYENLIIETTKLPMLSVIFFILFFKFNNMLNRQSIFEVFKVGCFKLWN